MAGEAPLTPALMGRACDGGLLRAGLGEQGVFVPTAVPLTDAAFFRGTHTVCAAAGDSLLVAGPGPEQSWIGAGAGLLGASVPGTDMLWILDPEDLSTRMLVTFPGFPAEGAATPDGNHVLVASGTDNSVLVMGN